MYVLSLESATQPEMAQTTFSLELCNASIYSVTAHAECPRAVRLSHRLLFLQHEVNMPAVAPSSYVFGWCTVLKMPTTTR